MTQFLQRNGRKFRPSHVGVVQTLLACLLHSAHSGIHVQRASGRKLTSQFPLLARKRWRHFHVDVGAEGVAITLFAAALHKSIDRPRVQFHVEHVGSRRREGSSRHRSSSVGCWEIEIVSRSELSSLPRSHWLKGCASHVRPPDWMNLQRKSSLIGSLNQ